MKIRLASLGDLDAVVEVALAGMPLDPQWPWRFPYRHQYPDDHQRYTKETFQKFFESDSWTVMVAEEPESGKIAAFAAWDFSNLEATGAEQNKFSEAWRATMYERRDANPDRMQAMLDAVGKVKVSWKEKYGQKYFYLALICTHPDFWGRGAGTLLCTWGTDLAKEKQVAITLLASPMGSRLYKRLGFLDHGPITVSVEGDEDFVTERAMAFSPN